MELLMAELEMLGNQKDLLEKELSSGEFDHEQLHLKSEELVNVRNQIDEKEMRWLELSEM